MLRPSLVLIGTAVALLGGGGVLAFAGWTSRSTSETFTITAAGIPQVPRPGVTRVLFPIIAWKGVRINGDNPVHRYVVTRHLGTSERVVCNQPATSRTKCIDLTALPGIPFTYTVHATHGEHWTGVESEPSPPLGSAQAQAPALDASGAPIAPSGSAAPTPGTPPSDEPDNPMMAETAPDEEAVPPVDEVPPTTSAPPSPSPSPSEAVTENLVPTGSP
jgi:hypothetical protein